MRNDTTVLNVDITLVTKQDSFRVWGLEINEWKQEQCETSDGIVDMRRMLGL
jgi:hypothetical protein